jgi:RNA polymerase sigma-70 factor (ECF subfamily)
MDDPTPNGQALSAYQQYRTLLAVSEAILAQRDLAALFHDLTERLQQIVRFDYLRALQFFGGFHGGDGRTWLLAIVRNTCYTWLQKNREQQPKASFDLERHDVGSTAGEPEARLRQAEDVQLVRDTLAELPAEFREVIVLRELGGLSYKEIARAVGIPKGTVMSRLSRARARLGQLLIERVGHGRPAVASTRKARAS